MTTPTAGLLLAAGAGTGMGSPKALIVDGDGEAWLTRQVAVLLEAGCSPVIVMLGAQADAASALLPRDDRTRPIVVADWATGMSASLRAGLKAAELTEAPAAVVTLVDLPGLPVAAVARLCGRATAGSLRQATYHGRPGHPVLIGRDHWAALASTVAGDSGGRAYLAANNAMLVECSDLWDGRDVDHR